MRRSNPTWLPRLNVFVGTPSWIKSLSVTSMCSCSVPMPDRARGDRLTVGLRRDENKAVRFGTTAKATGPTIRSCVWTAFSPRSAAGRRHGLHGCARSAGSLRAAVAWVPPLLLTTSVMGLVVGATLLGEPGRTVPATIVLVAGLLSLGGFLMLERCSRAPLAGPGAWVVSAPMGAFGSFGSTAATSSSFTVAKF